MEEALACLSSAANPPFIKFRDASLGCPVYQITLTECLRALEKCHRLGFFNFDDFHLSEYECFERVENGDFNWIVPDKFLAFCGPHAKSKYQHGKSSTIECLT